MSHERILQQCVINATNSGHVPFNNAMDGNAKLEHLRGVYKWIFITNGLQCFTVIPNWNYDLRTLPEYRVPNNYWIRVSSIVRLIQQYNYLYRDYYRWRKNTPGKRKEFQALFCPFRVNIFPCYRLKKNCAENTEGVRDYVVNTICVFGIMTFFQYGISMTLNLVIIAHFLGRFDTPPRVAAIIVKLYRLLVYTFRHASYRELVRRRRKQITQILLILDAVHGFFKEFTSERCRNVTGNATPTCPYCYPEHVLCPAITTRIRVLNTDQCVWKAWYSCLLLRRFQLIDTFMLKKGKEVAEDVGVLPFHRFRLPSPWILNRYWNGKRKNVLRWRLENVVLCSWWWIIAEKWRAIDSYRREFARGWSTSRIFSALVIGNLESGVNVSNSRL